MEMPKREPAVKEEGATMMAVDNDADDDAVATTTTDAPVENADEASLLAAALGGGGGAGASVVDATTFERRVEAEVRERGREEEKTVIFDGFLLSRSLFVVV